VKATTHPFHYDSICLNGLACDTTNPGDRSLADFFAIDYNPLSQKLLVVFDRGEKKPDEAAGHVATPMSVTQTGGPSLGGGRCRTAGRPFGPPRPILPATRCRRTRSSHLRRQRTNRLRDRLPGDRSEHQADGAERRLHGRHAAARPFHGVARVDDDVNRIDPAVVGLPLRERLPGRRRDGLLQPGRRVHVRLQRLHDGHGAVREHRPGVEREVRRLPRRQADPGQGRPGARHHRPERSPELSTGALRLDRSRPAAVRGPRR